MQQVTNSAASVRRGRNRVFALLLGVALIPFAAACSFAALSLPTSGTETCGVCHATREAWGLGPLLWRHSTELPAQAPVCEPHDWRRTGCWRHGSAIACHRGP
jgi:hypothetical protein